jgi:hypothetical protein
MQRLKRIAGLAPKYKRSYLRTNTKDKSHKKQLYKNFAILLTNKS